MSDRRDVLKGYALALLAAACWATGGLTAKWLFSAPTEATASWPVPPLGIEVEPTVLSGGRALLAFLLLAAYLGLRDRSKLRVRRNDLWFLAVFGVVGLAGVHYTYFKTISLTNVATAILLEYLAPVLVLVISVAFMGHKFTWSLPVGVAMSVGGCALVVGAIGGSAGLVVSPAGIAWGLTSAVFFAGYSLMGSRAARRFDPLTTLVYGLGFAALFWLIGLGPRAVLGIAADGRTLLAVLFMAIVSTIIPFSAFLSALNHIAPTNATVTSTIEPVIAGVGAFALFGESLTVVQLLGGVLVMAAILVVQLPERMSAPVLPVKD